MNYQNRIEKAIDVFLDALNKNTLDAQDCTMCAVGNLVTYEMKKKALEKGLDVLSVTSIIYNTENEKNTDWYEAVFVNKNKIALEDLNDTKKIGQYNKVEQYNKGVKSIEKYTDFTLDEVTKIEETFESTYKVAFEKETNLSNDDTLIGLLPSLPSGNLLNNQKRAAQIEALKAVIELMYTFEEDKTPDTDYINERFVDKANLIPIHNN